MNSDELIDYIEANHLEYQVTNILLSNRNEIYFIPIPNPSIMLSASKRGFGISGFKYPNLCYPDMPRPIAVPSELQQWKTWNKILYHPEHLAGFIMKTSDTYTVSIFYSRKQNKYSELRNKAFKMYRDFSPINSLDSFLELAAEAESNITGLKNSYCSYELADTLMDNNLKSSIARNNHDVDELRNSYAIRLLELYDLILSGNFLNYESEISYGENTICVSSKFMAVPTIKTDIDQDVAIIHNDDQIPQILFKLAFDLKPTTFLIATGYVYDSGLQLIVPALASCYPGEKAKRELICGDLFHYVPGLPQRSPNRQTAIKLNEFLEDNLFQHLYTHPKSFYHGKFYYLSNEENGFLFNPGDIEGFSNVLRKLLQDAELRNEIGRNARKHVMNNYGYSSHCEKIYELYLSIVK